MEPANAGVELWARSIAAHLLDAGWSEDAVRQLSDRHSKSDPIELQSLLDDAAGSKARLRSGSGRCSNPRRSFREAGDGSHGINLRSAYPTSTWTGCPAISQRVLGLGIKPRPARCSAASLREQYPRYQASHCRGRKELALWRPSPMCVLSGSEPWRRVDLSPALAGSKSRRYFATVRPDASSRCGAIQSTTQSFWRRRLKRVPARSFNPSVGVAGVHFRGLGRSRVPSPVSA